MATYYHFVDSSMFVTDESFNILSMAIVGGMGTIARTDRGSGSDQYDYRGIPFYGGIQNG